MEKDKQHYIHTEDGRGIVVDEHMKNSIAVSVFVVGGHATCFLNREQTLELIEAMQEILK